MKVLHIIPIIANGGAEHFVADLCNELTDKGNECEVLTFFPPVDNTIIGRLFKKDIRVSCLNKKKGFDVRVFFQILTHIRKSKCHIVHAHSRAIGYIILASLLLQRKVKFVATIHSEASREAGTGFGLWARKILFKRQLCIPVGISEETTKSFEVLYNCSCETIYNGVSRYKRNGDSLNIRDNEDQIVFIHPASCQPIKNQKLLFEAFVKLASNYDNIKLLWMGGNSVFKDTFESLSSYLGDKHINYLGEVNDVRDYLDTADAMCLSSIMEGMPITIIEAFSVGCPVITTPVGGCINMVKNGQNGWLSSDLSIDSYYNALESFIKMSGAERKEMKQKSLESYKSFSIEECADKYIELYKKGRI